MKQQEIVLLSCASELGAGKRGGSLGLEAMQVAARSRGSNFFKHFIVQHVANQNFFLDEPSRDPFAHRIHAHLPVLQQLSYRLGQVIMNGLFPVCFTGDHSLGAAVISGVRKAYPDDRLGVIWVDAHADLHSPFTSPSGNLHGMPLSMALNLDNEANRRHDPSEEALAYWSLLKNLGKPGPKFDPTDLVFIGLRSVEKEEKALIREHGMHVIEVDDVRQMGMAGTRQRVEQMLSGCDRLLISFDVDSMDPELVSDGTGTPEPHGFSAQEAEDLLKALLADERTCGLEITEINPCLDTKGNVMADSAFGILEACVTEVLLEKPSAVTT